MNKKFQVRMIHQHHGVMMRLSDATLLECRTTSGEVGIMAGHIPWMSVLEPGPLRVHTARRVHDLLVRGGLIRMLGDGKLVCMVQDVFDSDHIHVEDVRRQVTDLESRRPFSAEQHEELEQDLNWYRQCLLAVEKHLVVFSGVGNEEEEE